LFGKDGGRGGGIDGIPALSGASGLPLPDVGAGGIAPGIVGSVLLVSLDTRLGIVLDGIVLDGIVLDGDIPAGIVLVVVVLTGVMLGGIVLTGGVFAGGMLVVLICETGGVGIENGGTEPVGIIREDELLG
jgi:hypothetical protein